MKNHHRFFRLTTVFILGLFFLAITPAAFSNGLKAKNKKPKETQSTSISQNIIQRPFCGKPVSISECEGKSSCGYRVYEEIDTRSLQGKCIGGLWDMDELSCGEAFAQQEEFKDKCMVFICGGDANRILSSVGLQVQDRRGNPVSQLEEVARFSNGLSVYSPCGAKSGNMCTMTAAFEKMGSQLDEKRTFFQGRKEGSRISGGGGRTTVTCRQGTCNYSSFDDRGNLVEQRTWRSGGVADEHVVSPPVSNSRVDALEKKASDAMASGDYESAVTAYDDLLEDSEDPEKTRDYLDSRQMANSEITKQRATEATNTYSDNSGISDYAKQLAKSLGVKPEDVQNSLNAADEARYEEGLNQGDSEAKYCASTDDRCLGDVEISTVVADTGLFEKDPRKDVKDRYTRPKEDASSGKKTGKGPADYCDRQKAMVGRPSPDGHGWQPGQCESLTAQGSSGNQTASVNACTGESEAVNTEKTVKPADRKRVIRDKGYTDPSPNR